MLKGLRREKERKNKNRDKRDRTRSEDRRCHRCHKVGHLARHCDGERRDSGSSCMNRGRGPSRDRGPSKDRDKGSSRDRRGRPGTPYDRSRSGSGDCSNHLVGEFGQEEVKAGSDGEDEDEDFNNPYMFREVVYIDNKDEEDNYDWDYVVSQVYKPCTGPESQQTGLRLEPSPGVAEEGRDTAAPEDLGELEAPHAVCMRRMHPSGISGTGT